MRGSGLPIRPMATAYNRVERAMSAMDRPHKAGDDEIKRASCPGPRDRPKAGPRTSFTSGASMAISNLFIRWLLRAATRLLKHGPAARIALEPSLPPHPVPTPHHPPALPPPH